MRIMRRSSLQLQDCYYNIYRSRSLFSSANGFIWLAIAATAVLVMLSTANASAKPSAFQLPSLLQGSSSTDKLPQLYDGWFNGQIANQARSAVNRAVLAGITKLEVNFPPVPNVDEVKFGTPLNQKFGKAVVATDLRVSTGYAPGSDISRNLIAFANVYWAKKIVPGAMPPSFLFGGDNNSRLAAVLSSEPVTFSQIRAMGDVLSRCGAVNTPASREGGRKGETVICINPGGEETWKRLVNIYSAEKSAPFIVLNNAYSTTYDLGNRCGFEEAYYLKRISKGWVFRTFPGPWRAYLERPDGTVELLQSYPTKPLLRDVATLVREESFKRYAINNDRWSPGFGERL